LETTSVKVCPEVPAITEASENSLSMLSWTSSAIATVSVSLAESSSEATEPVLDTEAAASTVEATS
jgi:hypothetical protein